MPLIFDTDFELNEDIAAVFNRVMEAGYSEDQWNEGFAFAKQLGFGSREMLMSLVMSKILYDKDELEQGARFRVEPGSLD